MWMMDPKALHDRYVKEQTTRLLAEREVLQLKAQRDRLRSEVRAMAKLIWPYTVTDEAIESAPASYSLEPGDMTDD